jgi:hypothetical protein
VTARPGRGGGDRDTHRKKRQPPPGQARTNVYIHGRKKESGTKRQTSGSMQPPPAPTPRSFAAPRASDSRSGRRGQKTGRRPGRKRIWAETAAEIQRAARGRAADEDGMRGVRRAAGVGRGRRVRLLGGGLLARSREAEERAGGGDG